MKLKKYFVAFVCVFSSQSFASDSGDGSDSDWLPSPQQSPYYSQKPDNSPKQLSYVPKWPTKSMSPISPLDYAFNRGPTRAPWEKPPIVNTASVFPEPEWEIVDCFDETEEESVTLTYGPQVTPAVEQRYVPPHLVTFHQTRELYTSCTSCSPVDWTTKFKRVSVQSKGAAVQATTRQENSTFVLYPKEKSFVEQWNACKRSSNESSKPRSTPPAAHRDLKRAVKDANKKTTAATAKMKKTKVAQKPRAPQEHAPQKEIYQEDMHSTFSQGRVVKPLPPVQFAKGLWFYHPPSLTPRQETPGGSLISVVAGSKVTDPALSIFCSIDGLETLTP